MSATPKVLKLMRILANTELELARMEPKPYGGSNPYYYCSQCERSMIEASYAGHYQGCGYQNKENKIKSLKVMVNLEIEKFLESKEYESKRFQNYLWFKKEVYVSQLHKLEDIIERYKKTGNILSK